MPEPVRNAKSESVKINLIPLRDNKEGGTGKIFNWLLNGGRYLLIITELLLFSAFASRFYFDDTIQHQIETGIQPRLATIDYLQKNQDEFLNLQARLNNTKLSLPSGDTDSKILGEIQKLTPDGMLLDSLEIVDGELHFSGSVINVDRLQKFKTALTDSPVFNLLDVEELSMDGDNGLVKFRATTELKQYKPIATQSATFSKATL